MAYFTEPMGDEFKKALEEAMRELEERGDASKAKSSEKKKRLEGRKTKKKRMKEERNQLSIKDKRALKK